MQYDVIIIGGSIVGLATAYQLKQSCPDLKVLLLEKENTLIPNQTNNQMGIIHSGILQKPGTLRCFHTLRGYHMLLDFCSKEQVPYDLCGKTIIATKETELPELENIYQHGLQNGLLEIKKINCDELQEYEPHVKALAAIRVPYSGTINYKEVAQKFTEIFVNRYQGIISLNSTVETVISKSSSCEVVTNNSTFTTKFVVNVSGENADNFAKLFTSDLKLNVVRYRGEYFNINPEKRNLVKYLVSTIPSEIPFSGIIAGMINRELQAGPLITIPNKKNGQRIKIAQYYKQTFFQSIIRKMRGHYKNFTKAEFSKSLLDIFPEIKNNIVAGGYETRSQAFTINGFVITDLLILDQNHMISVLNSSSAATSSLSLGKTIAEKIITRK